MKNINKVKLKDIAQVKMGQSPDSRYYNSEQQGIPFLQGCAQFGKTYPSTSVYCSLPSKIARKGSILFSVRAPVGDINIADCDYCIGRGLAAITPKNINNEFLYYLLVFEKYQLIKIAQGSTFESINSTELENWLLPNLDSIPEQQQIAKILDTVDKAIAQTETLIAKYKRVKTGLMQDLLTRGIDENGQLRDRTTHKFKRSPLGMIPDEWEVVKLSNVCNKIGVGIATSTTRYFVETGIPLIRNQNISETGILMDDIVYISEYFSEINNNKKLRKDDILMVRTGYPGISCLVTDNEDGWQSFTTLIIRPNSRLIFSPFLVLFLNSWMCKKQITNLQAGGAQQNLNAGEAEKLNVILMNISEQKAIYNAINSICNYLNIEISYLQILQKIKTGLMQDLLSGKISIKPLLTNEP